MLPAGSSGWTLPLVCYDSLPFLQLRSLALHWPLHYILPTDSMEAEIVCQYVCVCALLIGGASNKQRPSTSCACFGKLCSPSPFPECPLCQFDLTITIQTVHLYGTTGASLHPYFCICLSSSTRTQTKFAWLTTTAFCMHLPYALKERRCAS